MQSRWSGPRGIRPSGLGGSDGFLAEARQIPPRRWARPLRSLAAGSEGFEPPSAGPKPASLSKLAYEPRLPQQPSAGEETREKEGKREPGGGLLLAGDRFRDGLRGLAGGAFRGGALGRGLAALGGLGLGRGGLDDGRLVHLDGR